MDRNGDFGAVMRLLILNYCNEKVINVSCVSSGLIKSVCPYLAENLTNDKFSSRSKSLTN